MGQLSARGPTTYLGSTVLGGAFRCRQFPPALGAALARVAVIGVAGAHLVGRAGNGRVNGVGRAGRVRVLGQGLAAGLASASSEEVFS